MNIKKICSPSYRIYTIAAFASIASFIPILFTFQFTHPTQDDYSYAALTHNTWTHTHSIRKMLIAAWQTLKSFYLSHSGSYTNIFINTIHAGIFGDRYYWICPLIIIILFCFSIYTLLYTILVKLLKSTKKNFFYIAIIVFAYLVNFMPFFCEAVTWWTSANYYIGFFSLACIVLSNLLNNCFVFDDTKIMSTILNCFLSFFLMGGSLPVILATLVFIFFVLIFCIFNEKYKAKTKYILPIFLVCLIGFCLNCFSPGVRNRLSSVFAYEGEGKGVVETILYSFYGLCIFLQKYTTLPFLFFTSLLMPLYYRVSSSINYSFKHPFALMIVFLFILYCEFCPSYYSLGFYGPGRCQDIYFSTFILESVILNIYFCGWFRNNVNGFDSTLNKLKNCIQRKTLPVICTLSVCFFMAIISTDSWNDIVCINATRSILNGSAQQYHSYMVELDKVCSSSEGQDVVFKAIPVEPLLLCMKGFNMREDPEYWLNKQISSYYNLSSFSAANE